MYVKFPDRQTPAVVRIDHVEYQKTTGMLAVEGSTGVTPAKSKRVFVYLNRAELDRIAAALAQ